MEINLAHAIRFLAADMVEQAQSGHPGMPMGMADVATVLFHKFIKFNPYDPKWPNRDRFILSAGHGSALLYSLLYLTGYKDIDIDQLKNFRKLGSKTAGHPEYGLADGVETSTGPLGQGLANGIGMAISAKLLQARLNPKITDHKVYVVVGDGCLSEGISHEAISLAGHLGLNNLIVLFDDNEITIDGPTSLFTSDNHLLRFQASKWITKSIDGHNYQQIEEALNWAQTADGPVLIACKTKIAYGAPSKQGTASAHGSPLGEAEIQGLRDKFSWPYPAFEIPSQILSLWRECYKRNMEKYDNWFAAGHDRKLKDFDAENNLEDACLALSRLKLSLSRELIEEPTRKSSERAIEVIQPHLHMIGGSADLTPSNNTKTKTAVVISKDNWQGDYLHYGIREHAMAALMNGIALYGKFIPFGGTFLVFSDYARPAIRLAALMNLNVIYIMTHDSIGLGEDGPTHQPIEHLAALRAIPNLNVLRPADFIETIECWEIALRGLTTPSILALSRQALKKVRNNDIDKNLSSYGAYILKDSVEFKVSIFASGSEVALALEVAEKLENEGIGVRVISTPSLDLFYKQSMEYQVSLLCNKSLKVAIEAGVEQGWHKIIGPHGIFIGMNSFGASAPAKDLFKHFGFNVNTIAQKIMQALL